MSSFLGPENIIHIKYIVAVFIIESVILDTFTWFGEDSAGISRRFIFEARVAYSIRRGEMARESLERLTRGLISTKSNHVAHNDEAYTYEPALWISSAKRRLRIYLGSQIRRRMYLCKFRNWSSSRRTLRRLRYWPSRRLGVVTKNSVQLLGRRGRVSLVARIRSIGLDRR